MPHNLHSAAFRRGFTSFISRSRRRDAWRFARRSLKCESLQRTEIRTVIKDNELLRLRCTGLSSGGEGVCRTSEGRVVFVQGALPGEVLDAQVLLKKKNFARAVKVQTLTSHDNSVPAPCPHFGPCGGCSLQNLSYDAQLQHKQGLVVEALSRVGKVEGAAALVRPVLPSSCQYRHRNKMEFSFSALSWLPQQAQHSTLGTPATDSHTAAALSGKEPRASQRLQGRQRQVPASAESDQAAGRQLQNSQQGSGTVSASRLGSPGSSRDGMRGIKGGGSGRRGSSDAVAPGFSLGLFKPGSNRVVLPVSACLLQPEVADEVLQEVGRLCQRAGLQAYDPKARRGLLQIFVHAGCCNPHSIRQQRGAEGESERNVEGEGLGELLVNFSTARNAKRELRPVAEALVAKFPLIAGVVNTVMDTSRPAGERAIASEHLLYGRPFLLSTLCGLEFEARTSSVLAPALLQISANSFFQTNTRQAERLYQLVQQAAGLRPDDVVLDLYCGTGTIGLSLAGGCRQVYGVEVVEPAVRDARRNAARNRVANAEFLQGDLDHITSDVRVKLPPPDVVVVDPARPGLSADVVEYLRSTSARRIVYVSCNPATQARDIAQLCCGADPAAAAAYRLAYVQPVDMFPHTMHVESVAVLDRV